MKRTASSIYGPVRSWRLGASLGVDLLCVDSICSFRCVYCQLGRINRVTTKREIFVSTEKVLEDLQKADWRAADAITLSGSGEPTLAANLGEAIEKIKDLTGKPIVVLTNSTLLHDRRVRLELQKADKILCKLDAWSNSMLQRVARPPGGISLESIAAGIAALRREFAGFLAVQTMLLRLLDESEIRKLAALLRKIEPDEVQLNAPTRPVPHEYFTETRGNAVEFQKGFARLRTITPAEFENIRLKLSEITKLPVITRQFCAVPKITK
jgi:wyosine [tRNA(Phe)-imidazoG37] synthetase (radical SAM superfamily)